MRKELVVTHSSWLGRNVLILPDVIDIFRRYRQLEPSDTEAGGIILGQVRGLHHEIITATEPEPGDYRSRGRFVRRDPNHNTIADELWKSSNCNIGYLGEWHTHPEKIPLPSCIDLYGWKKIASEDNAVRTFIIVGTSHLLIVNGENNACLSVGIHSELHVE